MTDNKRPADAGTPAGQKDFAQSGSINPQKDYSTGIMKLSSERIHELIDLVLEFNGRMQPYFRASLWIDEWVTITLWIEYGRGGYGQIRQFTNVKWLRTSDPDLKNAEDQLRGLLEGKYDDRYI